jgi:hypothetical protein
LMVFLCPKKCPHKAGKAATYNGGDNFSYLPALSF